MHSRIFQFSEKPISKDDFITEETFFYDEAFIGTIAEYVSEDVERGEDIEWLLAELVPHGAVFNKEEESIVFPKGFKESYFSRRLADLKKKINEVSLEEFARCSVTAYELRKMIEDKFSFYIYYYYPQPIDGFIRDLEEDTKYYIGGVIDYKA
jgi:hypothetical protein